MDSNNKIVKVRLRKLKGADSVQAFSYRFDNDLPPMDIGINNFKFNSPDNKLVTRHERNAQTLQYTSTDNDGISTHINFSIYDAPKEKVKLIAGTENAELIVNDLNLVPEFTTGTTTLSFNLPAKAPAQVKLTNTKGIILWTDKAIAGSFSKKIRLPLNGVYYLLVKQGASVAVKKVVKE
jgi:hypothetical protein